MNSHPPLHLLLPLGAAALFTVGTLAFKRAFAEGAHTRQAFHIANVIGGLAYLPLIALERRPIPWADIWQPAIVGFCVFTGGLATFAAIRRADVSLVAPLLGTKVLFVALGTVLLTAIPLTPSLWFAAALTAFGILVLGFPDLRRRRVGSLAALLYVFTSAAIFAAADVLLQLWAIPFGGWAFVSLFAATLPLLTFAILPLENGPIFRLPRRRLAWLAAGGALYAVQGIMMAAALGFFSDATRVNIVYSTRGLWALMLAPLAAVWLGIVDESTHPKTRACRLAGTLLLMAAIILAVRL